MKTSKKEEGHLLGKEKITEGQAGDLRGDLHAKGFSDPGKGCPLAPRPPAAPALPPSWPSADLVPQLPLSWEDGLKWIALCLWPARLTWPLREMLPASVPSMHPSRWHVAQERQEGQFSPGETSSRSGSTLSCFLLLFPASHPALRLML